MAKISIIIPVFNVEKYIERCLKSIINQSFKDIEILIVNDCTPDASMTIVKKYAQKDKRIKILENEINLGLSWSRQVGFNAANGEFIMFCDSDDWLPNNSIEILYNAINKTNYDIIIGDYDIYKNEQEIITTFHNKLNYGNNILSVFKSLLKLEISHSMCGKIFKSSLFKNKDFNIQKNFINSEDAYLFYQLVQQSSLIGNVEKSVYCYFCNTESSSRKRLNDRSLETMAIANIKIKEIISQYPELHKLLDSYLTYSIFQWMLSGSKSYSRTIRILKKYQLNNYLSLFYCIKQNKHTFDYLKILIKSM